MPIVAIAGDFLDAFAHIPRAQQRKVREFTEKFRDDPKSSAINYEKIRNVKDPKVRTVRIDQKYRAIILHPDDGDVYVLVWVDNHDEAMAWAQKRTFDVNPFTGALQIASAKEAQDAVGEKPKKKRQSGLLDDFDDECLLSFGIPSVLLPAVRAVEKPEQLLALTKHLPAEAAEAIVWLAEKIPTEEIRELIASPKRPQVNTKDLAAALEHPDSRRRFVTLQGDRDLASILDAPLEKWRVFLHPSQERVVTKHFSGPARVTGGAGTGKTVVAMHRARHLAKTICAKLTDRILFTTYTANLAQNSEHNLTNLCGEEKERIEVVHLHAWAVRHMRSHGKIFGPATSDEIDECWKQAILCSEKIAFDPGFLRHEWEAVIQANGIQTLAEYLKVSRVGRGQTLNRPQRGQVWKVFENYKQALSDKDRYEWPSIIQETRRHLEEKKPALPYRAIVVDEAQDFHPEEWKLIRAIVPTGPNDLFIVGDAHQRIYGRKVALRQCGIKIQGRASKLRINYRTTEQIRTWAMAMLDGLEIDDLDGDSEGNEGYKSLLSGPKPEVQHFSSHSDETAFLGKRLKEILKDRNAEDICLVARTNKIVRECYQPMLKSLDLPHTLLDNTGKERAGIRLATMHRVKGLEFPVMVLAGINAGTVPLRLRDAESDPVTKADHEYNERCLLFVAATRARDLLLVTSWGKPSRFLAPGSNGK